METARINGGDGVNDTGMNRNGGPEFHTAKGRRGLEAKRAEPEERVAPSIRM